MFLKRLSHLFPPVCFIFWLQHFNISHHTFRANKPYLAFVLRMEGSHHFAPSLLFAASTTCCLSKRETSVVSRSSTGWRTSTASPSATSGRRGGWTRSTPRPSSRRGSIAPQRCGGRDSLGPLLDPCINKLRITSGPRHKIHERKTTCHESARKWVLFPKSQKITKNRKSSMAFLPNLCHFLDIILATNF